MSLFDNIKGLFGIRGAKTDADTSVSISEAERRQLRPLYTFYRIGPDYITWRYPVDVSPLKEISDRRGLIGPSKYEEDAEFMRNIEDYNNMALQDGNQFLLIQLEQDLKLLATKYKKYGAYTLLGSLSTRHQVQYEYFKLAAEHGNVKGMVACGILLLVSKQPEKAREWLEKGAEKGDEIGMMDMAISYEYGTFTPIDYDKAAYYYRRLIKEHKNYFAYINLGVMYAMANYFHTALSLFKQANQLAEQDADLADSIRSFGAKDTLQNYQSCADLLTLPLGDRIKRAVAQYNDSTVDYIFCIDHTAPLPTVSANHEQPPRWIPGRSSEIERADIKEHKASQTTSLVPQRPEVKYPFDDFVFPTYDVQIRDPRIMGTQHELIFLEKKVHSELNQYIQQHLGQLRTAFQRKGYLFVYLPTHANSDKDIISSYVSDYEPPQLVRAWLDRDAKNEQMYWSAIFSKEHLPSDCAGFLRYKPNRDNPEDYSNYEYILFPFRAGTDWAKAFSYLEQFVGSLPFVQMRTKKSLPHDTMLLVDANYDLYLVDSTGNKLTENIKMPVLSKALYFTLLHHIDGIAIKYLSDYKDELQRWYDVLSNRIDTRRSIDTLIDPTNNSANEKLSRIRSAFESALQNYEDAPDDFIPTGKKSQPYIIHLSRTRIIWQPEGMNVF